MASHNPNQHMLVPSIQAADLHKGLSDYLTTTFALTEADTKTALEKFLNNDALDQGIFKGPFVRTRLPFEPAAGGWENKLDWLPAGFIPYGHQAAAFTRLSTKPATINPDAVSEQANWRRPDPTLVTTGTGSGKTESFLIPLIDHVLRAKKAGVTGAKALILYPMNALANDQAQRLAQLITDNNLPVTAALYTGEQSGSQRTMVTSAGLITDRGTIRSEAPDILLTNYKMLDMLLLREQDSKIWRQSALSLQYIVLDEFHTYDGAQGTDVAMLLRRLGMTLKNHWPRSIKAEATDNPLENPFGITRADLARPLGRITPVATSATLGAKGDPTAMMRFAHTIFGEEFNEDAVVTESRMNKETWMSTVSAAVEKNLPEGTVLQPLTNAKSIPEVIYTSSEVFSSSLNESTYAFDTNPIYLDQKQAAQRANELTQGVGAWAPRHFPLGAIEHPGLQAVLYSDVSVFEEDATRPQLLPVHDFLNHELVQKVIEETGDAVDTLTLAKRIFGEFSRPVLQTDTEIINRIRRDIINSVLSGLSVIRKELGRTMPSVEIHQWVRELSRINRLVGTEPEFSWSDDGIVETGNSEDQTLLYLPAIFCRKCGRSGWGITAGAIEGSLETNPTKIRESSIRGRGDFRPLIYAPAEGENYVRKGGEDTREELFWFNIESKTIIRNGKEATGDFKSQQWEDGHVLPVLTYSGLDSVKLAQEQVCPACQAKDSIRFVGSAIATMLSVSISTLFGSSNIGRDEKKALVFTDSVQDAAHRAGFVQARSHTMTLRAAFKTALDHGGNESVSLDLLAERIVDEAKTPEERYQLLSPSVVTRETFRPFWDKSFAPQYRSAATRRAKQRVAYDSVMEFGLNSRMGRTLELTGSVMADVDFGSVHELIATVDSVFKKTQEQQSLLEENRIERVTDQEKIRWVVGVLERVRTQGGIYHDWLKKFILNDGNTWFLRGGRPKNQGMPGFAPGRPFPTFPRLGGENTKFSKNLDTVASKQGWYALWTSHVFNIEVSDSAFLISGLFTALAENQILKPYSPQVGKSPSNTKIFAILPSRIRLHEVHVEDLRAARHQVVCTVCKLTVPGTIQSIDALADGPCMVGGCHGTLERTPIDSENYYRNLYSSPDTQRVVAREHTSLLPNKVRLAYEDGFKGKTSVPDAPNVLVATPTLEMGIDIGDLSTVMLSSLPKSVANYQQRIGRAGRLTGNALILAYVRGRGEHLPKLHDPLSIINGEVTPPATFLNAEEMLQRQYVASIVDALAASGSLPAAQSALTIDSTEPGNLLELIKNSSDSSDEYIDPFLNQYGDLLSSETQANLREWAREKLPSFIVEAERTFKLDLDELDTRLATLDQVIPDLQATVERCRSLETDNDERTDAEKALRQAQANSRFFKAQRASLKDKYWISNLEKYGILPNYTLLDDSVELNVDVTTWDPDSHERNTDVESFVRGASTALAEFAPGNTFYANSLEIKIDAVELGPDQSHVRLWQICPSCGRTKVLVNMNGLELSCPSCGSQGMGDTSQVFSVVEMTKVSAVVERDESTISDRTDDRERRAFTIVPTVNVEPQHIRHSWSLEGYDFGVDQLSRVTLRWLNLGPRNAQGTSAMVAGNEYNAPKFRICPRCGTLDREGGINTKWEHRFWCPIRDDHEDHSIELVLGRTLQTQGVRIHLPSSMQYDGSFAVPSLKAAVLLGMRQVLGGNPAHIDILDTFTREGNNVLHSLVLHDKVPGGTGYLSDFGTPTKVWAVLKAAYDVVHTCDCGQADERSRQACHRCLLPFAPATEADQISRASAEKTLAEILNINGLEDVPENLEDTWKVKEAPFDPSLTSPESWLESRFSSVLVRRLEQSGYTSSLKPKLVGNEYTFTVDANTWQLVPQPGDYGDLGTRPDFKLSTANPDIPDIAIYVDSYRYHSSQQVMRLTDDAQKRQKLRNAQHIVWAVTHEDINNFERPLLGHQTSTTLSLPDYITEPVVRAAQQKFPVSQKMVQMLRADSMTMLWNWILHPNRNEWEQLSTAVPLYLRQAAQAQKNVKKYSSTTSLHREWAFQKVEGKLNDLILNCFKDGQPQGGKLVDGPPHHHVSWRVDFHYMSMAFDISQEHQVRPALYLREDPNLASDDVYQRDWKNWLKYSNLLAFNPELVVGTNCTDAYLGQAEPQLVSTGALDAGLDTSGETSKVSSGWQNVLSDLNPDLDGEHFITGLNRLAMEGLAIPEIGHEFGSQQVPVTLWVNERIILYTFQDTSEAESIDNAEDYQLITADEQDSDDMAQAFTKIIELLRNATQ